MADFETKDSGKREEFATGSRRDTREGKGRFDLIPWGIVARFKVENYPKDKPGTTQQAQDFAMNRLVAGVSYADDNELIAAAGQMLALAAFEDGAKPAPVSYYASWSSVQPLGILRLAKLYERGAAKYGDRNWEKGQPLDRYLDSALRHFNAYRAGDKSEDHLIATVWNIIGYLWTKEKELAPVAVTPTPAAEEKAPATGINPRALKMAEYEQAKSDASRYCLLRSTREPTCEYCETLTRLEKELGL